MSSELSRVSAVRFHFFKSENTINSVIIIKFIIGTWKYYYWVAVPGSKEKWVVTFTCQNSHSTQPKSRWTGPDWSSSNVRTAKKGNLPLKSSVIYIYTQLSFIPHFQEESWRALHSPLSKLKENSDSWFFHVYRILSLVLSEHTMWQSVSIYMMC